MGDMRQGMAEREDVQDHGGAAGQVSLGSRGKLTGTRTGVPGAQQALALLWRRYDPCPGNFCMPWAWQKRTAEYVAIDGSERECDCQ